MALIAKELVHVGDSAHVPLAHGLAQAVSTVDPALRAIAVAVRVCVEATRDGLFERLSVDGESAVRACAAPTIRGAVAVGALVVYVRVVHPYVIVEPGCRAVEHSVCVAVAVGCVPVREVAVEVLSIRKHVLHVRHRGYVPS